MKAFVRILALLLAAGLLPLLSGCTDPQDPADDNTAAEEGSAETPESGSGGEENTGETAEKPPRDVYEDLSFGVPSYVNPDVKSVTVQSEGKGTSGRILLDFTGLRGEYIVSSTKVISNCHDVASCDTCGYTDFDGGAYLMSSHGTDQGGVTVTLATPIHASSVTGMTLTCKTTANAPASSMRILSKDQTNNAAFINTCGSMADAVDQWITVDLGVKDFAELADSDGYIRSFQMYFRNKNNTDCYVRSLEITVSPEELLAVDAVTGNCFFRGGAAEAVAEIIARRFTEADIRAEVKVVGATYRKNSAAADGSLRYKATVTLADGSTLTGEYTAVIPAVTGVWLDATDGQYGSLHDSRGQWQETFDPSGLLLLTDSTLSCAEEVNAVEYAVVKRDTPFDDGETVWYTPQLLAMKEGGIAHVMVNAFLDLGGELREGEAYRLLVRGVTPRSNYILHLDIPFTYRALSAEATQALAEARTALERTDLICPADTEDKAAFLAEELASRIANKDIVTEIEILGEGLGSLRAAVSLRYSPAVTDARLPVYDLDGRVIADVYNFVGEAFTKEALTVKYSEEQFVINLLTPFDGDSGVILASDVIYQHAKAPLAVIESAQYGYLAGEFCTPAPVVMTWEDAEAAEGKVYTVTLSESRDMANPTVLTVTEPRAEIYNLNIGATYYWQVASGEDVSPVGVFSTEDGYPRFIKLDGVSNARDIGGYLTADGRRVRQNLAYRTAHLDAITEEAGDIALHTLGIRTDLDLRGGHSTPLGSSVQHISVAMQWYEHIFEEEMYGVVRQTVSTFAKEENYPIVFHCSMGRDRTGTTAFLILGLLGVDEDTLRHEYYASFFSQQGAFSETEFPLLIANVNRLVKGFQDFGEADDTLQERIRAYLLHIGVTEAEIQSILDIWLE